MLDNFEIIDAHCHVYPEKILPRAVIATANFYGETAQGDGTLRQLLSDGQKAGIDRFIIESVATTPHQVKGVNEYIASEVQKCPERLLGLGSVHPESDDMRGDIEHLVSLGLKGIKIHPDIQGFAVDCDGFQIAYDICEELNLPILIHTGDKRYDFSNPNRLVPLLKKRPNLTVIAAHFGGWSIWETAVDCLEGIPNLYVDCSSAICYISPEKSEKIIHRYGADRVLFGTDFPLHSVKSEVENFMRLNLTDTEKRLILSENTKRIYGI